MKIAFISDTHLGYGWGGPLADDSIRQAREAFLKAIEMKVDFIVHPGDVFDERIPKPEVWAEALRLFSLTSMIEDTGVKPVSKEVSPLPFRGIPVLAIHGNHERRSEGYTNPVEALEASGHLVYLNDSGVTLEKDGDRVYVFGMGYTPESHVLERLKELGPKKQDNAYNIFVLHQNIKEFLPEDISFLSLNDLPEFDLVVNGHIHWNEFRDMGSWKFMMPGSTVTTQLKKQEASRKKGFYVVDTDKGKFDFVELESSRPFVFKELSFSDADITDVVSEVRDALENVLSKEYTMKPIVKLKLTGSMKTKKNVDKNSLVRGFSDDAIIVVDNQLETESLKRRIEELRDLQTKRLSAETLGLSILKGELSRLGYNGMDPEAIFEYLINGDIDKLLEAMVKYHSKSTS